MKRWCLRAASADRLDLFEAEFVMKDGIPEIRGGNVRKEPYLPHEVFMVDPKGFDTVRAWVRELEQTVREISTLDAVQYARARDDVSVSMTIQMNEVLKNNTRRVSPADFVRT